MKTILITILLTFGTTFFGMKYLEQRKYSELIGTIQKYEQLSKHAAKLEINYVTEKALRKKLQKDFEKEKNSLNGRIKILSNATFLIREKARKSKKSDLIYQGKGQKYLLNELRFKGGPPLGYVLIFDNGQVVSKIYNHQLKVHNVVSRDEKSGKYDVVSKANYILKSSSLNINGEKNWVNKPYPLKIVGGRAFIDPTEKLQSKSFMWKTRINSTFDFNLKDLRPGLGLSFAGYGVSGRDLDFKFLQVGVQLEDDSSLNPTISPLTWRPFKNLLPNTYIAPNIIFGRRGLEYAFSLQIGF